MAAEPIDPDAWRQRIYAMLRREKVTVIKGKWRMPEAVRDDDTVYKGS